MAREQKSGPGGEPEPWRKKVASLVAQRRFNQVLNLLDEVIHDQQMALFESEQAVEASRRTAWLYRIDLLRGLGRIREALAWACFESELQPQNITARALKEQLKRQVIHPP